MDIYKCPRCSKLFWQGETREGPSCPDCWGRYHSIINLYCLTPAKPHPCHFDPPVQGTAEVKPGDKPPEE